MKGPPAARAAASLAAPSHVTAPVAARKPPESNTFSLPVTGRVASGNGRILFPNSAGISGRRADHLRRGHPVLHRARGADAVRPD